MTTITKKLIGRINLVADGPLYAANLELPTIQGTALPNALDNQTLEEVYIICDTTLGDITINLPSITVFNSAWNVKIYICQAAGSGGVAIRPFPGTAMPLIAADTLNGEAFYTLGGQYETIYLHIVDDYFWIKLVCPAPGV
jgi:hypothetical protein